MIMGKTVNIEKSTFDNDFTSITHFSSGLLIGRTGQETDDIFLAVETPRKSDSNGAKCAPVEDLGGVDDRWVASHARNLTRMLPGGLSVVGFYACGNINDLTSQQPLLKKILLTLYSKEASTKNEFLSPPSPDRLTLMIDIHSKKIIGKVLNASDKTANFRPVETKLRAFIDRWMTVKVNVTLACNTMLPSERKKEKIMHQLQLGVEPFLRRIVFGSDLLVDGDAKNEDDLLVPKVTGVHGDNQRDQCEPPELILFGPEFPIIEDSLPETIGEETPINEMRVEGKIPGLAFVSNKTTVGETLKALREDIVRSIHTRLELLTEELQVTGGELEVPRMLLPQRVLVTLPCCPRLPLSDYKFFSETPDDVVARVRFFCGLAGSAVSAHRRHLSNASSTSCSSANQSETDTMTGVGEGNGDRNMVTHNCLDTGFEHAEQDFLEDELSDAEVIEELENVTKSVSEKKSYLVVLFALIVIVVSGFSFVFTFTEFLSQHETPPTAHSDL